MPSMGNVIHSQILPAVFQISSYWFCKTHLDSPGVAPLWERPGIFWKRCVEPEPLFCLLCQGQGSMSVGWRWWAVPTSDCCWVWDGRYWPLRTVAASQWQPSQLAGRWTEWQQPAGVPMKTSSHVIFGRQAAGAWSDGSAS